MWDKEATKTSKNDDTPAEGIPELTTGCTKINDLTKNAAVESDTLVVATCVVNDDGDSAENSDTVECPTETEPSDINRLLSVVRLNDGPSTSAQRNELNKIQNSTLESNVTPNTTNASLQKSVSTTATAGCTVIKDITNFSALTVTTDCDELPYTSTNANVKTHAFQQSPKPIISVKYFSPIVRAQNETVVSPISGTIENRRDTNFQKDIVAGPQIQNSNDNPVCLPETDSDTVSRVPSPASQIRALSPANSSVTSMSTPRSAKNTRGRRVVCLRHMRRAPKEPEEYIDALFPHIREAHNQIRGALLHAPLTDVKDNVLLKRKILDVIRHYVSGCKNEFERVGASVILCRRLKRNIFRLLDLFHEICSSSREDPVYLYHISQLIAVYNSLEIRLSFNLTKLQKCALIHRISHVIHKHLMVKDELLAKGNILRMFLHMPDMYSARFIMEPLFNTFLVEIPTTSNNCCQRELPDKAFVQYIIVLHLWKEMLRDPLEQVELINRAQHFMCPTKTLHTNPLYVNHLPTIHTRKNAVKDILNSLKFFHDLKNAAICGDILQDEDDDIEVVIDDVINKPFWDFGATYTSEIKHQRTVNLGVSTPEPVECVDLTEEDDQQPIIEHVEYNLDWLAELKERASERVHADETENIICLDSDSDGELFSGSIVDPTESYQDCFGVDTDYTSLDSSSTDDKVASEDDVSPTSVLSPNGIRTYLAPKSKKQINSSDDNRLNTNRPQARTESSHARLRDDDDRVTLSTKTSALSREGTLPLIVNTFTVSNKQNMHFLGSPRLSLDIGPERFGGEDMELSHTGDNERETRKIAMQQQSRETAKDQGDGYYENDNDNDNDDEDEYHSLPSTSSSTTTNLGKVIYSQALPHLNRRLLPKDDVQAVRHSHVGFKGKDGVKQGYKQNNEAGTKQVHTHVAHKPVKKQVKFNDNPIGPTRCPQTKLPIKPAIHLNKIPNNNQHQQPILSSSPQPRFASPSSSTSSTTESLKQMAQKGRRFVDRFKIQKPKILKSSSAMIVDSKDDDIIDVSASANTTKDKLTVSTQPIESIKAHLKDIPNPYLSVFNSNICKNEKYKMKTGHVSNRSTTIHGPKDISSTNFICNKNVEIMLYDSTVCSDLESLELENQVEMEEQNSNVSTTTGPNLESNTTDEHTNAAVNEKCIKNQTLVTIESTSSQDCRATSFESNVGSDICTSSTETIAQKPNSECKDLSPKMVVFDDMQSDKISLESTKKPVFHQQSSFSELSCTRGEMSENLPLSADSIATIGSEKVETILEKPAGGEADENECRQCVIKLYDENISKNTTSKLAIDLNAINTQQSGTDVNVDGEEAEKDVHSLRKCNKVENNKATSSEENVEQIIAIENETVVSVCHGNPISVGPQAVETSDNLKEQSAVGSKKSNEWKSKLTRTKPTSQNTANKMAEVSENLHIQQNIEYPQCDDAAQVGLIEVQCATQGSSDTIVVDEKMFRKLEQEQVLGAVGIVNTTLTTSLLAPSLKVQTATDKRVQSIEIIENIDQNSKIVMETSEELRNIKQSSSVPTKDCTFITESEEVAKAAELGSLDVNTNTTKSDKNQIAQVHDDIQVTQTTAEEEKEGRISVAEVIFLKNSEKSISLKERNEHEVTKKSEFSDDTHNIEGTSGGEQQKCIRVEEKISVLSCNTSVNQEIAPNFDDQPISNITEGDKVTPEIKEASHDISINEGDVCANQVLDSPMIKCEATNGQNTSANISNEHFLKQQDMRSNVEKDRNAALDKITADQKLVTERLIADQAPTNTVVVSEVILENTNAANKNETEPMECIESTTNSLTNEKAIAKVEAIEVHKEVFSSSAINSSSDGLVRLVAAVNAVEALDLTLECESGNVEKCEVKSTDLDRNYESGEKSTLFSTDNLQTANSSVSDLAANVVAERTANAEQAAVEKSNKATSEKAANEVVIVEKDVVPTSSQVISKEPLEAGNEFATTGIYFSGDKSPQTNLERLAEAVLLTEAAAQKCPSTAPGRSIPQMEIESTQSTVDQLAAESIEISKHTTASESDTISQKVIIDRRTNKDAGLTSATECTHVKIVGTEFESVIMPLKSQNSSAVPLNSVTDGKSGQGLPSDYPKIMNDSGNESAISIVHTDAAVTLTHDNVKMSKPTIAKQSAKCNAQKQNKGKAPGQLKKFDASVSLNSGKTVSVPNKATTVNSNPPLSHNTGPTFHSSFEKFVNSQKIKTELKLQRTSARISQLTATKNISKAIEKTVLPAEIIHPHSCVGTAKNSVSNSDINVVVRGKPVSKSLTPQKSAPFAPQSAELVVSPESDTPSVGASKFELKKRYSLRRSEQWKVVKNTSLRASPPTSNSECATTKKTITNTLTKRCIKIRLARAKMPTKAVKKVNPPTPTVQEVPSLESQFGDVSHRPITRRLAAALNSSLQMEAGNAVIEPMIKPSVMRGRKYRPKLEVPQEDAVPTKRKRCSNIANTSSNKTIEVIETETLECNGKRKECVAEVTKEIPTKSSGEKESPNNAFQKNTQIETVLDDTTPTPEKSTARRSKYEKIETGTEKVPSDSEITSEAPLEKEVITFETIFIEPLISIKSIRTKNLNSVETTKIEAQPIKEVESVLTANSKEVSIQNADALVKPDVSLPIEDTIPHESPKTSEKSEESNEVMTTVNKNVVETESQYQQDLTQPYINSSSNEKIIRASSRDILLAESVESAPITCHENSNSLPEKSGAQLVDISNFTSLTLELADSYSPTKSVIKCNPKCIHKCIPDEEPTIDLSGSHNEMNDKTENLNNSDSINILKTNMEADKLLEEYNHPARIITNANLKIPQTVQTPTDGRTPACSSVSFSFTGSDTSSSSTNSCSCSTSTTDLFKSQPSSFKAVQSQAPVAELLSSTSSSFHGISLLDLEHDVIINNDDLLSELMPTTIIDNITAASLEHNYAIKPLEMVIRNEDDPQYNKQVKNESSILNSVDISATKESYEVEDNAVLENTLQKSTEIGGDSNNGKSVSITSLKVSIPLALIKRLDKITADYRKSKDWYLSEKPSTSKAALEALARRRDTQLKTIITTDFTTPNVPIDVQEQEAQIFQKHSSKRDIVSTDRLTSPCQLVSRENCCQSPSLPLKKRRNISGVLEEDLFNATMLLSAEDNLVTGISQSINSLTEHKIHKPNEATDGPNAMVFENKNKLFKCENFVLAEDREKRAPSEDFKAQFENSTPEKDRASEINSVCDGIERLEATNDQQRAEANVPIDYQHNASSEQLTKPMPQTRDGINPLAGNEEKAKTTSCPDEIMELITECQNNTDGHIGDQHKSKSKGNLQGVATCETDKDPKAQEHFFEEFPQFTRQESSEKRLKKSVSGDVVQGNDKYTAENNARESHQELTFKNPLTNCDMLENLTNDHFESVLPENQEKVASNIQPFENQTAVCEGQNIEVAFLDQEKCMDVVQMEHSNEVSVPDQPDIPMNEEPYAALPCKNVGTDCAANIKSISMPEFKGNGIQDLISIQEVQHTKDNPLPNYENHPNGVILTSYDDQFFVTVCLNDSKETAGGFDDANNIFKSKEYTEKDFDIGNDLIISTHQIKKESTDLMNMINSSESSPVNLKKPESTFTTDADLLKTNELIEFTENLTNTTPPTNSDDLQLFTVASNTNFTNTSMTCAPTTTQMELFASSNTTALNFNSTPTFTSCEFGIDQGARSRANIADLSQINDLGFVEHETMQTTQLTSLPIAMEVDQRDCSMGFEQPQNHIILAGNQKTDALDCITSSSLQLNTNVAQIKTEQNVEALPVDDVCESQTSTFPTIKICSTNQTKQTVQNIECEPVEKDSLVPAIPTTSAELPHLTSLSSLSPILPLIKPTTTTIGTTISETTPIFNFSNIDPNTASGSSDAIESTSSTQSQTCNTSENCTTTMADSIAFSCSEISACTTAPAILNEKSTSPLPKSSKSQSQTARSGARARASTRVQIVTPQRKSDNTTPELTEKEETGAVVFTNASVSFCSTEFCTNQIAATLPAAYPATSLRYANLYHFEKYIQQLTTLIDVSGIIESARNLYVDKEALAEAHAALLAQATQFDDEGNAISQPLLLKYHKDGTISILNDNDECIILTANMSKMVKKLSLALSILQEQQSPLLGVRARIHALLKQLTQTATAKTVHTTNIISPSVIPTAVVNPTNLAENAQDIDFNALNAVDLYSGGGEDGKQSMQQQVHLINSNEQMYSNWHEVETNGLMTGITNAELHMANEDQLINIDPLPLLTDEGASGYEHAVAFDFDENSTILSSNESINAQRLENAFELALGRAVEDKNYNWAESEQNRVMQHWQQSQSSNEDSRWPMQEHSSSCRDIVYEESVDRSIKDQVGNTVMVNSVGVNTVAISNSESGIEELSGVNNLGDSNATAIGSVITLPPDRQGRQSIKKMIFQTIGDQPSNIPLQSTQRCRKKVVNKKTEKVAKARTNTASKRAAVTPAPKSTKIRNTSKQSKTTPNIRYQHTPQVVANTGSKQTATLHYRPDGGHRHLEQQQQQQRAANVKMSAQFVSGTSNLLQQSTPLITIDSVKNLQLFSQQHPQNSALGGSLQHNNNVRFLLATPLQHTNSYQRPRSIDAPPALSPLSSSNPAKNVPAQETLIQYTYQLPQTQPNFAENHPITELQLHSIKGTAQADVVERAEPTDMSTSNVTTITTVLPQPSDASKLRMVRPNRKLVNRRGNTETKISFTPSFNPQTESLVNEMPAREESMSAQSCPSPLAHQQQQVQLQPQSIQFLQTTDTSRMINSMQQKHEAELEQLRQQLIKQETHNQTELQFQKIQPQPQGQLNVEPSQRMESMMTTSALIQNQPHPVDGQEIQSQQLQQARQPQLITVATQPSALSPQPHRLQTFKNTTPPLTPIKAGSTRKRGRPRKYDMDEKVFLTTSSDVLKKRIAHEMEPKSAKSKQSAKIRPIAATNLNANSSTTITTTNPTNPKTSQLIITPPATYYTLINSPHESQQQEQLHSSSTILIHSPMRQQDDYQQQMRPSFTRSANAFNLIENVIIEVEAASQANVTAQLQSKSHLSRIPPTNHQEQNHHINAIATLFSSYQITKPSLVKSAPAHNSGSSTTLENSKTAEKPTHNSRKKSTLLKSRRSAPMSPHSVSSSRNHSILPTSLRENSPIITDAEVAADPKLNMKCAVVLQENEEVLKYKKQEIAFINDLLEKQREMQRQRALKRQELQNILKKKCDEGKRLMVEITEIKRQRAEAQEKSLLAQQKQQSTNISNRKRVLVRDRKIKLKAKTTTTTRSATPPRMVGGQGDAKTTENEIDKSVAEAVQATKGDSLEVAANVKSLIDVVAAITDTSVEKLVTTTQMPAEIGNDLTEAIPQSPKERAQSPSNVSEDSANANANFAIELPTASSSIKTQVMDIDSKALQSTGDFAANKDEEVPKAKRVPMKKSANKKSLSEKPKLPIVKGKLTPATHTRCVRSMTPPATKTTVSSTQTPLDIEPTRQNALLKSSLSFSSPKSSRTHLFRAPSLSPSIFMPRNRVDVRQSMRDHSSNTDFPSSTKSWFLHASARTFTKTLKVRLKRLQHLNMSTSPSYLAEKNDNNKSARPASTIPVFSNKSVTNVVQLEDAIKRIEEPKLSILELSPSKTERVQKLKQRLKSQLLEMDEKYGATVTKVIENVLINTSREVTPNPPSSTAEIRSKKAVRRKAQRKQTQHSKKLKLSGKATSEYKESKRQLEITSSKSDDKKQSETENGAQCDSDRIEIDNTTANKMAENESKETDSSAIENTAEEGVNCRQENCAKEQEAPEEPTKKDQHELVDEVAISICKETSANVAMDIDDDTNTVDEKLRSKLVHDGTTTVDEKLRNKLAHGAIVTQVVDVTPGRLVNDSLLGEILVVKATPTSAVLNNIEEPKIESKASNVQAADADIASSAEKSVEERCSTPASPASEDAINKAPTGISNEMAAADTSLAMLANTRTKPQTTPNIIPKELQNENSESLIATSDSISSNLEIVPDPPTSIGLQNDSHSRSIMPIGDNTSENAKPTVAENHENRNEFVRLQVSTSSLCGDEDSSSDCLLSHLSKQVRKMSDLDGIVDASTVHVIKDATMTLMSFEATPTLPTYLLNGESRDVPTPPAISTPAPTPLPILTTEGISDSEQQSHTATPTSALLEPAKSELTLTPAQELKENKSDRLQKSDFQMGTTSSEKEREQVPEKNIPTVALPMLVEQELEKLGGKPLLENTINSTASGSAISTSDHEVSSTQELIYIPSTKRSNSNTLNNSLDVATPTLVEETTMVVQNSQIDTTHHLPENSYYMRRRARKFSDEFTLRENKGDNTVTKVALKQRRKTFSSESSLHVQFAPNTLFTTNENTLISSRSTTSGSTSSGLKSGGGGSGGSSPSTTTEPVIKHTHQTRRRNHIQKSRNKTQSPLTGRSRGGGGVSELNSTFVFGCSRLQTSKSDMADSERCVVIPASAVVPPVNLGIISHAYTKKTMSQIKVFVPPEGEMCLENEGSEKNLIKRTSKTSGTEATTTSRRGRRPGSLNKKSKKPKLSESAEKTKANKTAVNSSKGKTTTARTTNKRSNKNEREQLVNSAKPLPAPTTAKAPARTKNADRASNRRRK